MPAQGTLPAARTLAIACALMTATACTSRRIERYPALERQLLEDGEPAPFVNVFLDGEDVRTLDGVETPVRDGSTIILLPAMAGGA